MGNNERMLKAKEHNNRMLCLYGKQIEDSVKRSKVYEPNTNTENIQSEKSIETEIIIEDMTTSEVVFKYGGGKEKIGVLNFASYRHAGGGFIKGSFAQEEALCHDSNLYEILSDERIQKEFYERNLESLNNNLYTSRLVYSPEVLFTTGVRCVKCDVITCAAPNRGAYLSKHQKLDNYEEILRDRIDHVLFSAYENEVETLVLGAFGCGVFGNDPYKVAKVFKELLDVKYSSCFSKVIFAIPKGKNLDAFKSVF